MTIHQGRINACVDVRGISGGGSLGGHGITPLVPKRKRRPEASVVWIFDGVVFADEADPGTGMRLSPGLRVTLKNMALAKLHGTHPVVHLLLGLCQTNEVRARYLDPDASGHLALARVLLDRRAEHISDLLSDLQRRRRHA